jgi:integrase
VLLALDTGLRRGELSMLTIHDLDRRNSTLTVRGETSKSRVTHEVALGHAAAMAVDRYIRDFREESEAGTDRLFLGRGGHPPTLAGMGQIFARIGRRSGVLGFMAHVCRHTWATNFRKYESGDLLDLKAQGGLGRRAGSQVICRSSGRAPRGRLPSVLRNCWGERIRTSNRLIQSQTTTFARWARRR